MRTTPKTIILDRLDHALRRHGATLRRSDLLTTAAFAFGYRNRETFDAAAKAGAIDAVKAENIGGFTTGDGTSMVMVRDPNANAVYAVEAGFLDAVEGERREMYGTSPYGHLLDLTDLLERHVVPLAVTETTSPGNGTHVAIITNGHRETTVLTAGSRTEMDARLARRCRSRWDEHFGINAPEDDRAAIEQYYRMTGEDEMLDRYVDDGTDENAHEVTDDDKARPERISKSSPVTATSPGPQNDRFVIGMIPAGRSGERMLWWSQEHGYGQLCDATVFGDMDDDLPDAGLVPGSVAWYQMPAGRDIVTTGDPHDRDISFLTNRAAEGRVADADEWRAYLTDEDIDIPGRGGLTLALGYLARVDGDLHFAPTLREWYPDSHAKAKKAVDAMAVETERLKPIVDRMGGFCMFDDEPDEGKVELTVFIPVREAYGVDPEEWTGFMVRLFDKAGMKKDERSR